MPTQEKLMEACSDCQKAAAAAEGFPNAAVWAAYTLAEMGALGFIVEAFHEHEQDKIQKRVKDWAKEMDTLTVTLKKKYTNKKTPTAAADAADVADLKLKITNGQKILKAPHKALPYLKTAAGKL